MKLQLNGEERHVEEGTTLAKLIEGLDLGNVRVAIERNFEIVPRERCAETILLEGDRLEVVTFVGGG